MPAKQLKMSLLQVFFEMTTQRNGFGQNSCAADQQACVFCCPELSSLLTKILTVIKTGLEKYCSINTSHTGVNNM